MRLWELEEGDGDGAVRRAPLGEFAPEGWEEEEEDSGDDEEVDPEAAMMMRPEGPAMWDAGIIGGPGVVLRPIAPELLADIPAPPNNGPQEAAPEGANQGQNGPRAVAIGEPIDVVREAPGVLRLEFPADIPPPAPEPPAAIPWNRGRGGRGGALQRGRGGVRGARGGENAVDRRAGLAPVARGMGQLL
jgi:hypothetical protein